jgi:ParB family chromosome partitioning protein
MAGNNKKYGLGRGLDALFGDENDVIKWDEVDNPKVEKIVENAVFKAPKSEIDINKIKPCRFQPRRSFDAEAMKSLSDSIRDKGVLQPLLLREVEGGYEIIAGERRFRASKLAGQERIPAYIRTAKDEQVMEWALIENIQREDLDAIEIALAYQRLMDDYNLTQERMSERVGKKRATVANYLRLLKLPAEIQVGIKEKKIDMGHARAILGTPSAERQLALYQRILKEGLSVRKVEELAQEDKTEKGKNRKPKSDHSYDELQKELSAGLGMKVKIQEGKVTIAYTSENELQQIVNRLR